MNSIFKIALLTLISFNLVACASFQSRVPSKTLKKSNSDNVLYFTKRDSIPKDVIYRPQPQEITTSMVDPAIVGAIAEAGAKVVGSALKVRQNVVLSDTELLVTGYGLNSSDISNLVNSLKSNIDSAK